MKNDYKALIVGGGASGLMCAIELLRAKNYLLGSQILILEKNDRVGKKLIATGNGQGNLTNANLNEQFFHGDKAFIKEFIQLEKDINIQKYLTEIGIPLVTAEDGKIFPISKQANAVLDILRAYLTSKGCSIVTDSKVEKVVYDKNQFKVFSTTGTYLAKKLVLAFGGSAGKQFGTDGTSYSLATDFGHKLTKLYPSLVQLKTDLSCIRGLKGLKERAKVVAMDNGTVLKECVGDLLFTEYGVSGNSIFSLSSYLTNCKNPSVKIEFLPQFTEKQLETLLTERQALDYIDKQDMLVGIVNKKIGQAILKTCKDTAPKTIARALKNFTLTVTGNLGFNNAQVTKGGIVTDQINPRSMQSKLVKNLYVIGEALNVDGDCGGYNLTFAFVSAIACAKNIKSSISED